MSKYHAVCWLDHSEARVFHFDVDDIERTVIHTGHPHQKLHHKAGATGSGKAHEDKAFYHDIANTLSGAHEILVIGPGQAKLEFLKYVHREFHQLSERIIGVETVDHPTDGQILAFARQYFKAADQLLPQL